MVGSEEESAYSRGGKKMAKGRRWCKTGKKAKENKVVKISITYTPWCIVGVALGLPMSVGRVQPVQTTSAGTSLR